VFACCFETSIVGVRWTCLSQQFLQKHRIFCYPLHGSNEKTVKAQIPAARILKRFLNRNFKLFVFGRKFFNSTICERLIATINGVQFQKISLLAKNFANFFMGFRLFQCNKKSFIHRQQSFHVREELKNLLLAQYFFQRLEEDLDEDSKILNIVLFGLYQF
jgi:hypothetical protein